MSELQDNSGRAADVSVLSLLVEVCVDPVSLNETDPDSLSQADIYASPEHPGEGRSRDAIRERHSAEECMDEGLHNWQPGLKDWSDRISVSVDVVLIGPAEVSRDAKHVLEVSGNGSIPAAGVVRGLKMCELISAKNFDSLGRSAPAENSESKTDQCAVSDDFHGIAHFSSHLRP